LWSGLALAPIALAVFLTSRRGAPAMYYELTRWWRRVLLVWTSLFAGTALVALLAATLRVGTTCRDWTSHPDTLWAGVWRNIPIWSRLM